MPTLRSLSRHTVSRPIEAEQTVLCSPHELIAIVTHPNDVFVYRLNGQVAFTIKNQQDEDDVQDGDETVRVTGIQWSPDGRRLAIAWSDGCWRIHEAEKGEVVFDSLVRDPKNEHDTAFVTSLSWELYYTDLYEDAGPSFKRATVGENEARTKTAPFLKSISLSNATAVLPHLSALPSHGLRSNAESVRFANQGATDAVFMPRQTTRDPYVEVLLLHTSRNSVQVMLDGTSQIGTAACSSSGVHMCTASMPLSNVSISTSSPQSIEVLDVPVQKLNSTALQLGSQATTQLTALSQYVRRAVQCIVHDYNTGISLPARFTKNVSMSLEENLASNSTLVSALLQVSLTGQIHPDLLEWLTESVKETGLKRWDLSVNTMYASIQLHLHSHISPALDRLSIVAASLRGLAKLHQGDAIFECEEKLFDIILDKANRLRVEIMTTLEISIKEWALWRAFAKAMKVWIEVGSATPNTKEALEAEERESLGLDHSSVVQYIQTVLQHGSNLKHVLSGADEHNLVELTNKLEAAIQDALASVTHWQSRLLSSARVFNLTQSYVEVLDMCAWPPSFVKLLVTLGDGVVELVHFDTRLMVGDTQTDAVIAWSGEDVIDAKLYDNGQRLLYLRSINDGIDPVLQLISVELMSSEEIVKHELPHNKANTVQKLLVSGRRGKEFCVLIMGESRTWTVLDLHSNEIDEPEV